MRIHVLGGTGYAGGHIVRAAIARGHEVTSFSRNPADEPVPGVQYVNGSVLDRQFLSATSEGADVVISALAPRGELETHMRDVLRALMREAERQGVRLGVIGGAGSLQMAPGGPRLLDGPAFPAEYLGEARIMSDALDELRETQESLDWFFVSPAIVFGAWQPGEASGRYRVGGDVVLFDEQGNSFISGADLAHAVITEIESPTHRRARFTVAY